MAIRFTSCIAVLFLFIATVSSSALAADSSRNYIRIAGDLNATVQTARDLKAIRYVENAHSQLDKWTNRLVSRLELGKGPRLSDPILDGRSGFQVLKLRMTYAGYAQSRAVVDAIEALADAHEQRLTLTEKMIDSTVDRERYGELSQDIDHLIDVIRNWSHPK